ncbi:MAG: hypothetical protein QOG14_1480 [Mycobacterium sp.]|nr:hypothetical protein [Mycobacterium sp.]
MSSSAPFALVAAWLGHADISFTLRTYVHAQPEALAVAAEYSEELPNGPRKRERDARLGIYPANAPPIGFQRCGERLGDF